MPWGGGSPEEVAVGEAPTDHVIIGDLPMDITEERLREIFGAYGTVKWCKLSHAKGGAKGNAPSAILELGSVDEAQYFVTALDENIPTGLISPIRVRYKPPSAKGSKGKGGGCKGTVGKAERAAPYPGGGCGGGPPAAASACLAGGKGGKGSKGPPGGIEDVIKSLIRQGTLPGGKWANDENTVFVSGLPSDTTNAHLLRIFSPFGAIAPQGAFAQLNPDGTAKGTGIINFLDAGGSQAAISTLNGAPLPNGTVLKLRSFRAERPGKGGEAS